MSRIAVKMDTDTIPVSGVDDLESHLDQLASDPTLPPDSELFDHVELQMTDANTLPLIPRLLPKIADILKRYQRDPAVLCSLAIKLLGPLSFVQVIQLASEEAVVQALRSPAPSANLLAMTILAKAAKSSGDAAILAANMKGVLTNFLTRWLSAPQVEVGEKGSKVLGDLLDIDCDMQLPEGLAASGLEIAVRRAPGHGAVWRRIFQDRDVYGLVLSLCSNGPHQNPETPHQLSLAQGRLLRILPRFSALNLAAVTKSHFPELHQQYAHSEGVGGLLFFAALDMIDKEDVLMHLSLIDLFETLLSIQRITPFSTYKMNTLRTLYREATRQDNTLKNAVQSLPDRTVPEEADELRRFIHDVSAD